MNHTLIPKKFAQQRLMSLYGINKSTAKKILGHLGLHPQSKGIKLDRRKYADPLGHLLDSLRISFRLRLIIFSRICIHLFTSSYRGIRRLQGLPTKGQRTHTNGKTSRRLKKSGNNFPFNFKRSHVRAQAIERTLKAAANLRNKPKYTPNVKPKGKPKTKQKGNQKGNQKIKNKKKNNFPKDPSEKIKKK